ncbi:putative defense protein isoform X2 [Ornithodoros turicata]
MEPRHDVDPQESLPPYTITVDFTGKDFIVKLSANNAGAAYRGFLLRTIRIQDLQESYLPGTFTEHRDSPNKVLQVICDGHRKNAVTHTTNEAKNRTIVHWVPDRRPRKPIQVVFRATVVHSKQIFWLRVDSKPVLITSSAATLLPVTIWTLSFCYSIPLLTTNKH